MLTGALGLSDALSIDVEERADVLSDEGNPYIGQHDQPRSTYGLYHAGGDVGASTSVLLDLVKTIRPSPRLVPTMYDSIFPALCLATCNTPLDGSPILCWMVPSDVTV